jgi:hemin uptake protein HemP
LVSERLLQGLSAHVQRSNREREIIMKIVKTLAASILLAGLFAAPAFADNASGDHDAFIMFTKNGVMQVPMAANAMIDEVVKGGTLIDDKSIIVMHNGKTYLVKDTKMSNGQMLMEYIQGMRNNNG